MARPHARRPDPAAAPVHPRSRRGAAGPRRGPDGGAIVAWAEGEGGTWQVVARRHQPHADAWLPAEPLSDPFLGLAPAPQLALTPEDGRVLAAWAQGGVLDGRVLVAELP